MADVHVITWRAAYSGLIPQHYLDSLDAATIAARWSQWLGRQTREFSWVAEEGDRVVAYATGGPEREQDREYRFEIYGLYVLPGFQGRGLGTALVRALAGAFAPHRGVLIWALRDNLKARDFYQKLGGRMVREHVLLLEGLELPEVGFGWERASELAAG